MARILIVDDDREMEQMLVEFISSRGNKAVGSNSGGRALQLLRDGAFDVVLTDLKMKTMDGLELLRAIRAQYPGVKVIIMTAFGSIETAIEAIKNGATDYLTKPFKMDLVSFTLERVLQSLDIEKENVRLKKQIQRGHSYQQIVGKSKPMKEIFSLIERIGPSGSNVLISGESGTGKELVAKAIHNESGRRKHIFMAINCAAIPEGLLESELFGSVKGSFTGSISDKKGLFEEAGKGTLFLDEIGDMPVRLQTKLLRVLQDKTIRRIGEMTNRKVDVRIVSATNQPLEVLIKSGQFREDLFYRLNVIPINLPPLRERKEDIPLLVDSFLKKYALDGQSPKKISKEALRILIPNPWRGNVRELENVIERACVLSENDKLGPDDFEFSQNSLKKEDIFSALTENYPSLEEIEDYYIRQVLEYTHYHKEKTAGILGINRRTLLRKEKRFGIGEKNSLS